jgi:hypothetical protein
MAGTVRYGAIANVSTECVHVSYRASGRRRTYGIIAVSVYLLVNVRDSRDSILEGAR